jgi:hypothetical protein
MSILYLIPIILLIWYCKHNQEYFSGFEVSRIHNKSNTCGNYGCVNKQTEVILNNKQQIPMQRIGYLYSISNKRTSYPLYTSEITDNMYVSNGKHLIPINHSKNCSSGDIITIKNDKYKIQIVVDDIMFRTYDNQTKYAQFI